MTKHLKFDYLDASMVYNEKRHAETVMDELGIKYQHSTPQMVYDAWWFWNCENIPENLPPFITAQDWSPMDKIGYGLSREVAEKIRDYVSSENENRKKLVFIGENKQDCIKKYDEYFKDKQEIIKDILEIHNKDVNGKTRITIIYEIDQK